MLRAQAARVARVASEVLRVPGALAEPEALRVQVAQVAQVEQVEQAARVELAAQVELAAPAETDVSLLGGARPRSFEAALRDLAHERAKIRESAARDMARHAEDHRSQVLEALTTALADEHADVRAAAASSLGDIEGEEAFDALVSLSDDAHAFVRQMALSALGAIRDERALPVFAKALESEEPSDRFQAVMGFARTSGNPERVRQMLLTATRDEDALVRHIGLRMAEERGSDDVPVDPAFAARAKALLNDDSDIVCVAAAIILGRLGSKDGAQILSDVASREVVTTEHDDEAAAIELCGELKLEKAIPALVKRAFGRVILLTRDPFVWHARVALARLGHARAVKWVLDELGAWTRERRTLGVAAAGRARVAEARSLIVAMVGDDERADAETVSQALALLDEP